MKIVIGDFINSDITYEQKLAIMTNKELIELVDELINKIYKKYKCHAHFTMFVDKDNSDLAIVDSLLLSIKKIFKDILQENYKSSYSDYLKIEIVAKNRSFEVICERDYIWTQYMDNKQNVFTL